jgi:hypothetical protein
LLVLSIPGAAVAQEGDQLGAPPPPEGATPPAEGEGEGTPAEGEGTPAEGEGTPAEGEGTPAEGEGEATPAEGEGVPPADAQPASQLQLIVVDAAPYGVDPVVGQHVSDQMRATGAAMGYSVVPADATVQAAQSLQMPYPPSPADLWRVTYASQSERGAFARVWAHGGVYVVEISVASLDNTGPFFARGNAGASDLHAVVDQLLRQALPPPDAWQQAGTAGAGGAATFAQPGATVREETEEERLAREREEAERRAREEEDRRRTEEAMKYRWHLVLQTEGAIGTSQDGFYNHLVGARIDFRVSRAILFGAYFAYANLAGKGGRADNIYFSLMVEDRIRISSSSDISIPLRLHLGYLPFNGPVIRLSAGLNIPLSSRFQLGVDLLAPTFWILPDRTAVSLNIAAELILRI